MNLGKILLCGSEAYRINVNLFLSALVYSTIANILPITCLRLIFQEKFKPAMLHKVGVFLNPHQKSMKALDIAWRQEVDTYIADTIDDVPLASLRDEPPPKQARSLFDEFDDEDENTSTSCEIERYKQMKLNGEIYTCPVTFWKVNESSYPGLAKIAKKTFAAMGSSAPSERVFSLAGHVISKRRSKLKPDIVDDILLLNSIK